MEFILKNPILVFIIVINLVAVVVCIADKIKAIYKKRRVSEKSLFTISFLGGATLMYLTMLVIRHKTKHKRFMVGLPLIILLHAVILLLVIHYFPNFLT
ncbi:MAG: DUF1294 domain-containing protein [Ruminococcaceae bacterium]|nr:DUF1294 domain-containing protein [Oscillospiraceae bacterium]